MQLASQTISLVRLATTFGLSVLLATTWRLWTPQDIYPRVPLLRIGVSLGSIVDWFAAGLLATSLVVATLAGLASWRFDSSASIMRRYQSIAIVLSLASMTVLFMTDQHRLQPWAYQMVLLLLASVGCSSTIAMRLIGALQISIYFFSGISKLDFQFVYSVGREFVVGLANLIGVPVADCPESAMVGAALALPVVEILIAVGLVLRRSRRFAVFAAVGMHLSLIILLSPIGLGHQPGVALWNLFSMVLVLLVFGRGHSRDLAPKETNPQPLESEQLRQRSPRIQSLCSGVLIVAIVAPVFEPVGLWDHWLAWGLYAPHNSRVRLFVPVYAIQRMSPGMQSVSNPLADEPQWAEVLLARASIEQTVVPIYPQARFQVGVAMAILDAADITRGFRVEVLSASNRITGARTKVTILDRDALQRHANRYIFNAAPR